MANKRKRVLILADGHAGHRAGLTPPKWWGNLTYDKWADLRAELWNQFITKIRSIRPIDYLFYCGDAIDGPGSKSGSSELIAVDPSIQCEIATETIKQVRAKEILMVYGTPYHTGDKTDFEALIAKDVGAIKISSQEWPVINGITFDLKHKIANTSIPHGKGTPISKERLWNIVHWEHEESQPKSDILIRGHVHYYFHAEGANWHGFVCPGLQGYGSKYGARQVQSLIHFGFIWFDIKDKKSWIESPSYHKWILTGAPQKKEPLIL